MMKPFFSQLQFAKPLFLFLLLVLPLLWRRWRERSPAFIVWRSVIFCLLIFALAAPERVSEIVKEGERIFAFDVSRSIPAEMRRWMAQQERTPGNGDRTYLFAGTAQEVGEWDKRLGAEQSNDAVKPGQTNLENLFSSLLQLPPTPRTVFLFTDGWETQGDVGRLLPSLALSGLKVFPLLPAARPAVANVSVKKVLAPHQATSGESVNLRVMVENDGAKDVEGTLTLQRDGQPLKSETVTVKPGSHIVTYPVTLPSDPLVSFQASFAPRSAGADLFPQNNHAITWVSVKVREKVLLLNGRSGEGRYLEEILKRRGYEVTSLVSDRPPPSPAGYGLVIFNNVEREKFSPAYLSEIERHVSAGNAFLMLGGEGSFGPGGYRQTPIETVLPLDLKEPKKEEKTRAVVLVIDKSGSMREGNRILYAKEAAKAVVGQLKDRDLLGVVGFDIDAFVVVPLAPLETIRPTFASQIDRLKPGGRTYLYPAIVEAKRQLELQSAGSKHVVILSDGETGGSGSEYIDIVGVMKRELKITISAVAIGDEANIPLLKRIAQSGGGFFHHTYDPTTLPQIVLRQLQEKPDEGPLVEKNFTPLLVRGSELLAGFPERSFPAVRGYTESEVKKGAQTDLVILREERRVPLLASWRYGKGRTVAFTADLHGRWTREWISWRGLEEFWAKVFEWLRPSKESLPPHEARINLLGHRPVLDLYLYGEESATSQFRYSFTGKGGKGEGLMKRLAPGHFQTELPFSTPGDYRLELVEERRGQKLSYPPLGYSLTFDPRSEIPQSDFNVPLLEQLARATGGEINPSAEENLKTEDRLRTSAPLRSPLIFLALVLFLLEIMARRFLLREIL